MVTFSERKEMLSYHLWNGWKESPVLALCNRDEAERKLEVTARWKIRIAEV